MIGDAGDSFFVDRDAGLLGCQFRHQYFLLFLIRRHPQGDAAHASGSLVDTQPARISDADSVRRFKRTIRQLLEIFLRFTHRYWFHEVSDQPQAKGALQDEPKSTLALTPSSTRSATKSRT